MKKYTVSILIIALVSIFSTAVLAQGKGNRRNNQPNERPSKNTVQRDNAPNTPPKSDGVVYQKITPCNQMNDDAGIAKNRQCTLPNGQVTTVRQYCQSNPSAKGCNQGNNRNRQTGNSDSLISEIGLPAAKGNRKNRNSNGQNQVTGGTIPVYATGSDNTTTQGNSVSQAPNNSRTRPRGRRNQRNAPANTNGEASPENRETSESNSQGKTNNGELQETQYDFVYPTKPEAIVTWHENSGSYGYTTANSGWEFIQTSAGIAVRRRGQEGTVVAHTKCNDTANYTFGYGGNSGSIDMIMCRPLHDGLPRLKPSIMIVPKSQQ